MLKSAATSRKGLAGRAVMSGKESGEPASKTEATPAAISPIHTGWPARSKSSLVSRLATRFRRKCQSRPIIPVRTPQGFVVLANVLQQCVDGSRRMPQNTARA